MATMVKLWHEAPTYRLKVDIQILSKINQLGVGQHCESETHSISMEKWNHLLPFSV